MLFQGGLSSCQSRSGTRWPGQFHPMPSGARVFMGRWGRKARGLRGRSCPQAPFQENIAEAGPVADKGTGFSSPNIGCVLSAADSGPTNAAFRPIQAPPCLRRVGGCGTPPCCSHSSLTQSRILPNAQLQYLLSEGGEEVRPGHCWPLWGPARLSSGLREGRGALPTFPGAQWALSAARTGTQASRTPKAAAAQARSEHRLL